MLCPHLNRRLGNSILPFISQSRLVHTFLLTIAFVSVWNHSGMHIAQVLPLILSGVLLLVVLRNGNESSDSIGSRSNDRPVALQHGKWIPITTVALPLFLGILNVLSIPVSLYLVLCGACLCLTSSTRTNEASSNTVHAVDSLMAFLIALTWLFTGLCAVYPYLTCRGFDCPYAFALIVSRASDLFYGTLALPGFEDYADGSYAYITRSGNTALTTGSYDSKTFLLSAEHLQVLPISLLLAGTLLRSVFQEQQRRVLSVCRDCLTALLILFLVALAFWQCVRSGTLKSSDLWQYRDLSLIVVSLIWVTIHWLVTHDSLPLTKASPAAVLTLSLPKLMSPAGALAVLIGICSIVFMWHDPGRSKPGRIVIDEFHSDWELSDLPMNAKYFGVKTVYNYAFMKEIFEQHFQSAETNSSPITSELLDECDVLVLKTPTVSYSPQEVEAIRVFVESGGGLWLIGDHTNIFGMNTYLNQVANTWGIRFNADAVPPLSGYYQEVAHIPADCPDYHRCGNRQHELIASDTYLNHPIIGSDLDFCLLLTSCSVSAPLACDYITVSRGTFVDHAVFGGNTFFGDLKYNSDERYGSVLQNVAVKPGKGRVAVWSDSTLFSNFSMCMPGVPNLAVRYVNWLNRSNLVDSSVRIWFWRLAAVTFFILLVLTVRSSGTALVSIYVGILASCCAIPIVDLANSRAYPEPDIRKGFQVAAFDQQYSQMELPTKAHVHHGDPGVYESFFVLMQRLHLMPVATEGIRELGDASLVVVGNPASRMAESDVDVLRRRLQNGGTLLLLHNGKHATRKNKETAAELNDLLSRLGASARIKVLDRPVSTELYGPLMRQSILARTEVWSEITGVDEDALLLQSAEGMSVVTSEQREKGKVIVCAVADLCSNDSIGEPSSSPIGLSALKMGFCLELINEAFGHSLQIHGQDDEAFWDQFLRENRGEEN